MMANANFARLGCIYPGFCTPDTSVCPTSKRFVHSAYQTTMTRPPAIGPSQPEWTRPWCTHTPVPPASKGSPRRQPEPPELSKDPDTASPGGSADLREAHVVGQPSEQTSEEGHGYIDSTRPLSSAQRRASPVVPAPTHTHHEANTSHPSPIGRREQMSQLACRPAGREVGRAKGV